ncbi:hypothetical protein GGI22_004614 [Coemansia erecta]|nr:hypothetical protein GGI22_004614 [Coemansia erecta]
MATGSTLAEHISLSLTELVEANSKGLETTIYADSATLQIINASYKDGLLGLIENGDKGVSRVRNVRSLEQYSDNSATQTAFSEYLPNSSHAMFIVGSVAWPSARGNVWSAITGVLLNHAYSSCTFCSLADPTLWPDIAACYPPDKRYFATQQLTAETVSLVLSELLIAGCTRAGISADQHPVSIVTLPAQISMPLAKDMFVLPDAGSGLSVTRIIETQVGGIKEHHGNTGQLPQDGEIRQQMERVSLNIVSFLKSLRVRGRFYSFGEFSSRVSRRCIGLARNVSDSSEGGSGSEEAMVVLLDRALDLVSGPLERLQDVSHGNPGALDMWETLLMNEKPVAMQILRRRLINDLQRVGGTLDEALSSSRGKVTVDQLETLVNALADIGSIERGKEPNEDALVDVARGILSVEAAAKREHWSEIEGAEKTLKLIIGGIKDTLQEATDQQHHRPFAGASLLGSGSENANDSVSDDVLETEMAAAWDQVLAGIPKLTASMIEHCKGYDADEPFEKRVVGWLLKHTPAPGMITMAASLLSPARCGVPQGQRMLAEQRLASDYVAVCNAMAAENSNQRRSSYEVMAEQWATRTMDMVGNVAVGRGQRSRATQWRNLVGLSHGLDGVYSPLVGRIAADVLTGGTCPDLKHAEQGKGVAAAANLLKGIG